MTQISKELAGALDAMQRVITKAEETLSRLPMANETKLEFPCTVNDKRSNELGFVNGRLQLLGKATGNNYRPLSELPIALRLQCCQLFPEYFKKVKSRAAELPREVMVAVDAMKQALAIES